MPGSHPLHPRRPRLVHAVRQPVLVALTVCAAALATTAPLAAQAPDTARPAGTTNATRPDTALKTGTSTSAARGKGTGTADDSAAAAAAAAAKAHRDSAARAEAQKNARTGGWDLFPKPYIWAVIAIILLGALGALAGDLVADGTRLDKWRTDDTGWILGFPGRLVIGVVAALIVVLGINPPNGSWPVLMSTALAVGVASEAVLLAVIASWKARMADLEARRTREAGAQKLETVRAGVQGVLRAPAVAKSAAVREVGADQDVSGHIDRLIDQAKAEFLVETAPLGAPGQARLRSREAALRPSRTAAAAEGKEVVVKYKVPGTDFTRLLIDDIEIVGDDQGIHRAQVGPGQHFMRCQAQTAPNIAYEVEITDPPEARWKPDPARRAAPDGVIDDVQDFNING